MNIKMISIAASITLLLTSHFVFAADAETSSPRGTPHLIVFNTWGQGSVKVKEGLLFTKDITLSPGRNVDWPMYNESISNLQISYHTSFGWEQIPGCPNGNFSGGLTVYVSSAPWDPRIPVCHIA